MRNVAEQTAYVMSLETEKVSRQTGLCLSGTCSCDLRNSHKALLPKGSTASQFMHPEEEASKIQALEDTTITFQEVGTITKGLL